jgi:hypothetical protein
MSSLFVIAIVFVFVGFLICTVAYWHYILNQEDFLELIIPVVFVYIIMLGYFATIIVALIVGGLHG